MQNDINEFTINPNKGNPMGSIQSIENDFRKIIEYINMGDLVVCQFSNGCIFINNTGELHPYKVLIKDTTVKQVPTFNLPQEDFKSLYNDILNRKGNEFWIIKKNGQNMMYFAFSITDALMCLRSKNHEFGRYIARELN